ncbi:MAG: hypothetical protein VKO65_04030 [Cyanobacteriota bacterium]|nr:hypothetical protein [Cyanobacteriota bacterium]
MRSSTRHGVLLVLSLAVIGWFPHGVGREGPAWRLSMATAYTSLGLLGLCLAIGPWSILRGRPNPLSSALRRDVGIWAGGLGLLHVVAGLQVHFRGHPVRYFLSAAQAHQPFPLPRLDAFGIANHLGLIAALLLIPLLASSNNAAPRRLGPRRWKGLQRSSYAVMLLVIAHGILYMSIEGRPPMFSLIAGVIVLIAATFQGLGYLAVRRGAAA